MFYDTGLLVISSSDLVEGLTLIKILSRRYDIQHKDTQHNGIQHKDTQHNGIQHNDTQHKNIPHYN
jgi:hypothetical protein